MKRIAIIGAGVSGLTVARELRQRYVVKVFEREDRPGGLIRCKNVEGSLFHICGGHVFNSKRQDVLDWFWGIFDKDKEFIKNDRNSVVCMPNGSMIPYPIENHIYLLDKNIQMQIIDDLLAISKCATDIKDVDNFESFLRRRFGDTLYQIYFRPYNEKIWRKKLSEIPLSWLDGKLPMPTVEEMIYSNINHVEEKQFVHSTFYYEKQGGSQYIANKLAEGTDIVFHANIGRIEKKDNKWIVNNEVFDKVVFCGNVKELPYMIQGIDISKFSIQIDALESHGTTSVFCEIDKNEYSWIYQPSDQHESHRIICTGNFSHTNNAKGKMTATIEFTDSISKESILDNLTHISLHPKYLDHHYSKYTYPIQSGNTRHLIRDLKKELASHSFYLTGRFAEWEYYNMDAAIGAALDFCRTI